MERARIGIVPGHERSRRGRLFDALEGLLPVRFVAGCSTASACLTLGAESSRGGLPTLALIEDERPAAPAAAIALSGAGVDARLRGRVLQDSRVGSARLSSVEGEALASRGSDVLWLRRGEAERSAVAPLELEPDEPLRDRLQPRRWFALLPLVQFLRRASRDVAWTPPPPRATFLIDDPNLHWTSYGFLRFAEVAAAARERGFHVAFATIPLDAWFAHPAAASAFRENAAQLSLLVHGNDHSAEELGRPLGPRARRALLGQALRRIEAFEQRSGVPVARVMTAPHGVCSEEMARAMPAFGFEGIAISRPYPWLARPPGHWLARPADRGPTVGMRPAELVAGGLPVFLRTTLHHDDEDFLLRAFLDQPLIVSGHHDDLTDGVAPLVEIAASINRMGDVRWGSFTDIARASFTSRLKDGVMRIRPYARTLSINLPQGTEAVSVEPPPDEVVDRLEVDGAAASFREPIAVTPGRLELRIARRDVVDPGTFPARRGRPWPLARRMVAEGRDRLWPLLGVR